MTMLPIYSWGKVLGALLGLVLSARFGLLGLIFGIYLGNKLDQAIAQQSQQTYGPRKRQFWTQKSITLVYQLAGHLAKIDGTVSPHSIALIEHSWQQFSFSAALKKTAKSSFNQGKTATFNPYITMQQLQVTLLMQPAIKNAVATLFIKLVEQDKHASAAKFNRLETILQAIGIAYINTHQQRRHTFTQQNPTQGLSWAYNTLGIKPGTNFNEVKRKYRKLISDHHPDRLAVNGKKPSEEAIKTANHRTFEIKKAYSLLKAHLEERQT